MFPHLAGNSLESSIYATQCYGEQKGSCETFVLPTLPYHMDKNATCPFEDEVCKRVDGNLLLDTGIVDSIKQLGLNNVPHFTLQHRVHCAPLKTEGYTEVLDPSDSVRSGVTYSYGTDAAGRNISFQTEPLAPQFGINNGDQSEVGRPQISCSIH